VHGRGRCAATYNRKTNCRLGREDTTFTCNSVPAQERPANIGLCSPSSNHGSHAACATVELSSDKCNKMSPEKVAVEKVVSSRDG